MLASGQLAPSSKVSPLAQTSSCATAVEVLHAVIWCY